MRLLTTVLLCLPGLSALGCGGGSGGPLSAPSYHPEDMASEAIKQLDKNGNGAIEGAELDACPGLKTALSAFDTNADKKISQDEFKSRFQFYKDGSAGAVGFTAQVTLDNSPLADATVTFTPEPFMGGSVKEASGRTGSDGRVSSFTVGGSDLPGLPQGVYRVSVTKDGTSIPARYNAQSSLGCEVSGGGRGGSGSLELKLTSR